MGNSTNLKELDFRRSQQIRSGGQFLQVLARLVLKSHLHGPGLQRVQIAPDLRSFGPAVEVAPSAPLHEDVEERSVCEEEQVREQLMDDLLVGQLLTHDVVHRLEDADDRLHFLWLFVAAIVVVELLERVRVQDSRQSHVQNLQS